MKRPAWLISFFTVAMFMLLAPLWPKFGIIKSQARFAVYHPPAFHAYSHQIRLEVDSLDMQTGFMLVPRIQHFLEDGLAGRNFQLTPNARTLLHLTLTDATAFLETVSRPESVNVHVGEHREDEKDSQSKQVEDCAVQTVPVTYLVSSGHLAVQVKANDAQSQTLLMSRLVERTYHHESAIAGPPKCHGEAYSMPQSQLHDPFSILSRLGDEAVGETLPLAAGYDEPRDVLLAVDDELKPGNAQAEAGGWRDALDTWTNASVRSTATEAARQYNRGVAHEALAAMAMRKWDLQDASSHVSQAQECYAQALKLDPKEKYFRDTLARAQIDQQLLQQELDQAAEEESPMSAAAPGRPAVDANAAQAVPVEGLPLGEPGPVHDYRVYARTRLGAQKGQPTEALRRELLASAPDYGVEPGQAIQVMDSETQRLGVTRQNMEKYREDFRAAATDGEINAEVRQMLRKRQQILHLADEQVREVESQFKFRETN